MKGSGKFAQTLSVRTAAHSAGVGVYTPERLAKFFLNNAMDGRDYLDARKEVESMGIDPDRIPHQRWHA
jgi:hypothetical protein